MSSTNSNTNSNSTNKEIIWKVAGVIVPILCVFLTYFLTNSSAQATIVERLSTYFDFVDESMSYEQALQAVYEESQRKDELIEIFCKNPQNLVKQRITPHFLIIETPNYYEFTTKG